VNFLILGVIAFGLLAWAGRRPLGIRRALQRIRRAVDRLGRRDRPTLAGMSERDARAILGVSGRADRSAIEAAYRRLMRAVHPDHGGSAALAAEINAARDRLLGGQ